MMACISAYVFALIKFIVVLHVLFHWLANWMVLVVVHNIRVGYILRMYATTALYQRKLLLIQILIGVRCEAAAHWLLRVLLIVAARRQVW